MRKSKQPKIYNLIPDEISFKLNSLWSVYVICSNGLAEDLD